MLKVLVTSCLWLTVMVRILSFYDATLDSFPPQLFTALHNHQFDVQRIENARKNGQIIYKLLSGLGTLPALKTEPEQDPILL